MSAEKHELIKKVNIFLDWYLGKEYTPKDIFELILSFLAIVFVIFGFLKNKTYYEDVSLEFYSIDTQGISFPQNIYDEIVLDESPTKIVLVSPANVAMKVDIMKFKDMKNDSELIYETKGDSKTIEPGDALKISYTESEGIPNYQLHISTEHGEADIPLIYNGRYNNINKTKIKATRKVIPYFLDKILN
ncbi:hypothetical protein ACJZQ1_002105 [Enterococcus hirae]